jgi:histidinol-phosphate/aromatic aminotransferase/cobyric acid decarboxylase-like protein
MSFGFKPVYQASSSIGDVQYIPGSMSIDAVKPIFGTLDGIEWKLPFPILQPVPCQHGNGSIETHTRIIRADVLDAWYPPSPDVLRVLKDVKALDIQKTPGEADSLKAALSFERTVPQSNIIVGPGSSALMYTVFPLWFKRGDRVLLVTPTYAEYPHLLTSLGCVIDEVHEARDVPYHMLKTTYAGIVLVNPNSPSGNHIPHLASTLLKLPITTRVWIDETYIDYVSGKSLEPFAAKSPNVVVCKSMSKIYALSGLRLAYMVGSGVQLEAIRERVPPWWCSTLSIKCGIAALSSQTYYVQKMKESRSNLEFLKEELESIDGVRLIGNPVANYASFILPCDIHEFMDTMKQKHGIYLKEAHGYPNAVRISVQRLEVCGYMGRVIKNFFLHLSLTK